MDKHGPEKNSVFGHFSRSERSWNMNIENHGDIPTLKKRLTALALMKTLLYRYHFLSRYFYTEPNKLAS